MSLAMIEISQGDIINNKSTNKGDSWQLMRIHYAQGDVTWALRVFLRNPHSNPGVLSSPRTGEDTTPKGWKTC